MVGGVPAEVVLAAAAEAERIGAAPLDVLLCSGEVTEADITAVLADELGAQAAFSLAELAPFDCCRIEDADLALRVGVLAHGNGPEGKLLVAVRGRRIEKLTDQLYATPELAARVVIVPARLYTAFIRRQCARAIAEQACAGPARIDARLTVGHLDFAIGPLGIALIAVAGMVLAAPSLAAALLELALAVIFLVHGLLRCLLLAGAPARQELHDLPEWALPGYTILIPLYREARMLQEIAQMVAALDYPAAKLQVLLLLESGDAETIAAAEALDLPPPFEIVIVPDVGPRTKPKALNYGLVGARGKLLAVYDAEDRPEPSQLRIAAARLCSGPKDLACVQAALAIDNARPMPLARLFAIEYAALFDAFLPALGTLRLPILLGGTSNHFRTEVLKQCVGWDPLNVTEDADLGIRLARLGYRVECIASTTYEEAPARLWPWIRQRTRWMKGFLLTWAVHGGAKRALADDIGWRSAVVAELLLAATPLAAIAHLFLFTAVPFQLYEGTFLTGTDYLSVTADTLTMVAFGIGYYAAFLLSWQGLVRRRRRRLAPWLLLLPLYWCLMAIAACRAVYQLGGSGRSTWEKTEHGREDRTPLGPAPGAQRVAKVPSRSMG